MDTMVTEEVEDKQQSVRQSSRIKAQGRAHMKISDKAEVLQAKKNLEGNSMQFKNSFAVLENSELLAKSNKMGINTKKMDLEYFDIMKDLELARANLAERSKEELPADSNASADNDLPFEEVKYITWKSDSSDEEGFKVVSTKKHRKKQRKISSSKCNRKVCSQPVDGIATSDGDIAKTRSGYNLRGRVGPKKIYI